MRLGLAGHARTGSRRPASGMPRSRPRSSPVRSPDSQRQRAVGPEPVVDVLVARQKAERPLRNQLPHRMLDPPLAPVVAASRGVRSSGASAWRNDSAPPSALSRPPSPTALGLKLKLQRFAVRGILLRGRCSDCIYCESETPSFLVRYPGCNRMLAEIAGVEDMTDLENIEGEIR